MENQKPKRDSRMEDSGKPHFILLFKAPLDNLFVGFYLHGKYTVASLVVSPGNSGS